MFKINMGFLYNEKVLDKGEKNIELVNQLS